MNFSINDSSDETLDDINITSLVDVVFMLLIFFVITTTFKTLHSIDINLPTSESSNIKTQTKPITISVDKNENLFINDKQLSLDDLEKELSNLKKQNDVAKNKISITISADKIVKHGTIVKILDLAQQTGTENIAIATIKDS